ncbi:uncharacterized protein N7515_002851 [Penicillium bovifimosum]|uniref:Uncharacterized protein n=1 Tax=Penicillium bovifimosum TaxID=126998 RepID=A0A9W9HCP9_9EURO|nr:uncharacterized protein N7515_002851 [Penicillium bovifimosum]KAJ5144064.1 hypothetical protein N7515_002851 [Penicillium bovifimosum]
MAIPRFAPAQLFHLLTTKSPQPPTFNPQTMQVSRTFYRAALLNLTVTPFVRATLPASTSIWAHHPRLHSILFPQCTPTLKTPDSNFNTTQTRTMSDSSAPAAAKPDAQAQAQNQDESNQEESPKQPLYLPASDPSNPVNGDNIKFDMSGGGTTVKLDHLGPMVVNVDGTLSQIGNWKQMSDIERENTLRVLGKRNQKRLEALRAKENEAGGEGSA